MGKKILTWEELKKENPWGKEIFNIDTNELIDKIRKGTEKFVYS